MSQNLDHHIAALLEDHDCVIIPDFGGFVGNYAPARINKVNHRFDPPYRKISFNKLLTHNDGLLAAYVAQKENEQYAQAMERVKNYGVFLKAELKESKRVEFDRIGILFQLADGTFRFEQLKNANLFREGFGLDSFFSKTIDRKPELKHTVEPKAHVIEKKAVVKAEPKVIAIDKKESAAEQDASKEKEQPKESKRKVAYWPAAAVLVGASVLGYGAWLVFGTPILKSEHDFHGSDLNPFSKKTERIYEAREALFSMDTAEPTILKSISENDGDFVKVYDSPERDKTLVVSLEEKVNNAPTSAVDLRYHVIGGCFGEDAYAQRMVGKYNRKGSNASVIDMKGTLHRVSIGSFATKKEAQQALASFRDDIPNAWILYK